MESQHREQLRELNETVAKIEAETAPLRDQEQDAHRRFDALATDQKRTNAAVKRAEIEQRNLQELIEKRQAAYADLEQPKEDRQKLLDEISSFDKQLPGVIERFKQGRTRLEQLQRPVADAEEALLAVRGQVSERMARSGALRAEAEQLARTFASAVGTASQEVEEEARQLQEAWAALGEQVLAGGVEGTGRVQGTLFFMMRRSPPGWMSY